jgi:hypothetical protein
MAHIGKQNRVKERIYNGNVDRIVILVLKIHQRKFEPVVIVRVWISARDVPVDPAGINHAMMSPKNWIHGRAVCAHIATYKPMHVVVRCFFQKTIAGKIALSNGLVAGKVKKVRLLQDAFHNGAADKRRTDGVAGGDGSRTIKQRIG